MPSLGHTCHCSAFVATRILAELHLSHPGIVRMKELARSYVWWPKIDEDIERTVHACNGCQLYQKKPPNAPLHPWEWPARPWQRVHVDFAGPFLGSMFLLLVDAHSKWPEVVPMNTTTSMKTIECLRTIFASYGLPEQLISDNGPQFISQEFHDFVQANGIQHIRTAPYHPSTNGLVERFVQTFKHAMRAGKESTTLSLTERLQRFLLTYRTTPHATTRESPSILLHGRQLRTRLDLLRPNAARQVEEKQLAQASSHSSLTSPRQLDIGQSVIVRDYRPGRAPWIAGTIATRKGLHYEVEVSPGNLW